MLGLTLLLIRAFGPPIWVVFVTLLFKPDVFETLECTLDDIADVDEFNDAVFIEFGALADDAEECGGCVDEGNTEAAEDTDDDNDEPDDDEGKLFGNVDDNDDIDDEGKFDDEVGGPEDEIGIVPPGGADPVVFGRPAPTVLLLILLAELFPATLPGIEVLAFIVGEELDCGKGIVGRFGILLPVFWFVGAFEFCPRIPGLMLPLIRGFIPRVGFMLPGPPIGPPIIIGPFDSC